MKKLLLLCAALFAISAPAYALGNSGCGLGYIVFSGSNGLVQEVIAVSLNATSGNQTFAMTFGTSGCTGPSGIVSLDKQEKVFVAKNHEALSEQMSQGNGAVLTAFGEVLGCDSSSLSSFAKATQAHYGEIFAADAKTAQDVLARTHKVISQDANLAKSCVKAS